MMLYMEVTKMKNFTKEEGEIKINEMYDKLYRTTKLNGTDNEPCIDVLLNKIYINEKEFKKNESDFQQTLTDSNVRQVIDGKNYIKLAFYLNLDQDAALRLMVIGSYMGLFEIDSLKSFGLPEEIALPMAKQGCLSIKYK